MATIIVPLASGTRTKEVMELAAELVGEGVNPDDAIVQANTQVDDLYAYAEEWNTAVAYQLEEHTMYRTNGKIGLYTPLDQYTPDLHEEHMKFADTLIVQAQELTGQAQAVEDTPIWIVAKELIDSDNHKQRCIGYDLALRAIGLDPKEVNEFARRWGR